MRFSAFLLCLWGSSVASEPIRPVPSESIAPCWNIGMLRSEDLGVTISVEFEMTDGGVFLPKTMTLVSWTGGGESAARRVYDTARRAVILCNGRATGGSGTQRLSFGPKGVIQEPATSPLTET